MIWGHILGAILRTLKVKDPPAYWGTVVGIIIGVLIIVILFLWDPLNGQ